MTPSPAPREPSAAAPAAVSAVLLLGPTGSGKTPLGEMLEDRGLKGRRCLHFDFGAQMRAIVERGQPLGGIGQADIEFLRQVLAGGALLENEHFALAGEILRMFIARRVAPGPALLILNGLPRHIGQAAALEPLVRVEMVVHLDCPAESVLRRIEVNTGGDRTHRADDQLEAVARRIALYTQHTAPLVDHYRRCGVRIVSLAVSDQTTADDMWRAIEAA